MTKLSESAKNIQVAVNELRMYEQKRADSTQGKLPAGQRKEDVLNMCDEHIARLHAKIEEEVSACYRALEQEGKPLAPKSLPTSDAAFDTIPVPKPTPVPTPPSPSPVAPPATTETPQQPILPPSAFASQTFHRLSKSEREQYIKEINLNIEELKAFVTYQKIKQKIRVELKKEDYTLYKPNEWGTLANKYAKKYADQLIKKYPHIFQPLFDQFQRVDMPILSHSYVSVILFFTIIAVPAFLITFLILNLIFKLPIVLVIFIALSASILTLAGFYFYPASLLGDRRKRIKKDIPFALVHMSAVAGSGAHPISIFELLVESEEYPELKKEIRKLLNYVNLFGYNLSTALRNVAATTPSEELKELLNGMVSTIETGGDLRGYLKGKADDALNTYRLDRKKEVEAISTFAEIYTAILIAAPLLFLVTLAIINTIGGQLGGLSVKLLAQIGIFAILPILNIGYMIFIRAQSANL